MEQNGDHAHSGAVSGQNSDQNIGQNLGQNLGQNSGHILDQNSGQQRGQQLGQDTANLQSEFSESLDQLPDDIAAQAFRRLVRHLQHRSDAQNIDLMGLSGFCRNCLSDWIMEAGFDGDKAQARALIHGMAMADWKAAHQSPASEAQLRRMEESIAKNA